jgi:hypothetical protein
MTGTVLQLAGLVALITAGVLVSVPVALGAVGVVLLYLGLASDRGGA